MSTRFINCSACKGCHTGRGGQYCQFAQKTTLPVEPAGTKMASGGDDLIPDRDSDEYEPYLARRIREEEERLDYLQSKSKIAEMEAQLAQLRIKTADLDKLSTPGRLETPSHGKETGVASALLAASQPGAAGSRLDFSPGLSSGAGSSHQAFRHRSKEEKEILSKLRAISLSKLRAICMQQTP